jgi:hypothetical protein
MLRGVLFIVTVSRLKKQICAKKCQIRRFFAQICANFSQISHDFALICAKVIYFVRRMFQSEAVRGVRPEGHFSNYFMVLHCIAIPTS